VRDRRGRSPAPKRLGDALGDFRGQVAPETPLAAVQMIWGETVGERIASVTEVVEEREGVLTIECSSAVWAQELEMMAPRITARLSEKLGESAPSKLRFRVST